MTGAASGIGLKVSKLMLDKGLIKSLVAVDISPKLMDVAEELSKQYPQATIIPKVADVTDHAALTDAFSTSLDQPLNIVGNNAGIGGLDWEKVRRDVITL